MQRVIILKFLSQNSYLKIFNLAILIRRSKLAVHIVYLEVKRSVLGKNLLKLMLRTVFDRLMHLLLYLYIVRGRSNLHEPTITITSQRYQKPLKHPRNLISEINQSHPRNTID